MTLPTIIADLVLWTACIVIGTKVLLDMLNERDDE